MFKTALMLIPVFLIIGVALWFLIPGKAVPIMVSNQPPTTHDSSLDQKLSSLEEKVNSLEGSNSALLNKISQLESVKVNNSAKSQTTLSSSQKTPVLLPINPGGSIDSTDWKSLTSGSITVDPKDYPGYKNAYLIINLSVYVGQGKAFARITNSSNGLSILDSEVSTDSYAPVRLTSKPFKLPAGANSYTIELKTLVGGYPAQAADSFLQITY